MFAVAGGILLAILAVVMLIGFAAMMRGAFRFIKANAALIVGVAVIWGVVLYHWMSYH